MAERPPRPPDRIREIARYVLQKYSRGERVPCFGEAGIDPKDMIDLLINEDSSLIQIVNGTALSHLREDIEMESKLKRDRSRVKR